MKLLSLSKTTLFALGLVSLTFSGRTALAADASRPEIAFAVRTLKEENVEGPNVERTYFVAGGKRVVFGMPKGCRIVVNDGGFLVHLTDTGLDGEVQISRSAFTPDSDLAAEALKYRDEAANNMPRDATEIEAQPPVMNPYPYNGWKSLGFSWNYLFGGRRMVRTVTYINLEMGVQVVVTTLAAQKDAEKVGKITRQFMSSWWVMGD